MILVTGSTGTNGTYLIRELSALGAPTRALVRTPEKANIARQEGAEEIAVGDFEAPETLDAALEGVERAFLVAPFIPQQVEWEGNFVEAAGRAGVRHVVKLSVLGAHTESPLRLARPHAWVERQIEASGIPYTFLRPNEYMQNTLSNAPQVATEGRFYAPFADARVAMIDVRDIAAVAARTLTEPGHEGRTYELTGPEAISTRDVAEKLSEAIGKPVDLIEISIDDAWQAMIGAGMSEWYADGLVELFHFFQAGYAAGVANGVAEVTGREPRRFEEFARDHRAAFAGTPEGS